jgi:predicted NAD/FAD-binding protein
MSFAVSLGNGALEYSGHGLGGLLAQRRNVLRPRFWSMLGDVVHFYRKAPRDLERLDERVTLGDYLSTNKYGRPFRDNHLLPMAAAIWSSPPETLMGHPAAAFIRFCVNHGLLNFRDRPAWRTVTGGSRAYVKKLTQDFAHRVRLNVAATAVQRMAEGVLVRDASGEVSRYDHAVIATHADEALSILADPTPSEQALLGVFKYQHNTAIFHSDSALMPKRRAVWSSWNYLGSDTQSGGGLCVTYWMNRLQAIPGDRQFFVTLNPLRIPRADTIHRTETYEHPIFDVGAVSAQKALGSLQGQGNTWFCGAYFGAGFHEDGLKSGLAVAEALGGLSRPWTVPAKPSTEAAAREFGLTTEAKFAS